MKYLQKFQDVFSILLKNYYLNFNEILIIRLLSKNTNIEFENLLLFIENNKEYEKKKEKVQEI